MMKKNKSVEALGGQFWKKINEAKENGITNDEFERIEELECGIAEIEQKIEECKQKKKEWENEVKLITKKAKKRLCGA